MDRCCRTWLALVATECQAADHSRKAAPEVKVSWHSCDESAKRGRASKASTGATDVSELCRYGATGYAHHRIPLQRPLHHRVGARTAGIPRPSLVRPAARRGRAGGPERRLAVLPRELVPARRPRV